MNMSIANQLRKAAKASGLSMLQMSKRADVPYQAVHGLMRSNRDIRLSTIEKLCRLFDLELTAKQRTRKGGK
jgi:transcriptional regulator with XRE-family HTH domain